MLGGVRARLLSKLKDGGMALYVKFRAGNSDRCFVSQVLDSDDVLIQTAAGTSVVRLYGIDAPERNQKGGHAAFDKLRSLAHQKAFTFERYGRDKYGRLVADLRFEDGRRLSVEMVRAGCAWWYKRFAFRDAELQEAEKEARRDRRGLWKEEDPTAPWNWRRRRVCARRQRSKASSSS